MRQLGVLTLLIAALSLSSAAFASAQTRGQFVLTEQIFLPPKSVMDVRPAAFLLEASGLQKLVATGAQADSICLHEWHIFEPSPGVTVRDPTREKRECYHGPLEVVVTSAHEGWVALAAAPGATLTVNPSVAFTPEHRTLSTIASPDGATADATTGDERDEHHYYRRIEGNHLYLEAAGDFHYTAPGGLKFRGPHLQITAQGKNIEYDTSDTASNGPLGPERVLRWAYLEANALQFTASTTAPAQFATITPARLSWDGEGIFVVKSGTLHTPAADYQAPSGAATTQRIEGAFAGTLRPGRAAGDVLLDVEGDFRSTTMTANAQAAMPLSSRAFGWPVLLAAVAVGIGVTGAASWGIVRFRRERPIYSAEDCLAAVAENMDEAKDEPALYEEALTWARYGRRADPRRVFFVASEAFCLVRLGRVQEALKVFEIAHKLASNGSPARDAAVAAHEAGRPAEEVEAWLARSLDRTPSDLEALEAEFPEVAARPSWVPIREKALTCVQERARAPQGA